MNLATKTKLTASYRVWVMVDEALPDGTSRPLFSERVVNGVPSKRHALAWGIALCELGRAVTQPPKGEEVEDE